MINSRLKPVKKPWLYILTEMEGTLFLVSVLFIGCFGNVDLFDSWSIFHLQPQQNKNISPDFRRLGLVYNTGSTSFMM